MKIFPSSQSTKTCPCLLNIYGKVKLRNEEIKTLLEEFSALWFEIWHRFEKHTIWDFRGAAHRGKNINMLTGLSAQKRTYYILLRAASRGKWKDVRLRKWEAHKAWPADLNMLVKGRLSCSFTSMQNHWIAGVRRDLWRSTSPTLLL